nr:hypothetical protein [uncultured Oscillibacter sp.]
MRRFKSLLLVLPMMLMLSTCAAPAYAFSDEDAETPVETPAPTETPAQPLTPEGNMALVDDIGGEAIRYSTQCNNLYFCKRPGMFRAACPF